jgi:hypothetical protein
MAYDKDFYEMYRKYLIEKTVRISHNRIFAYFWAFTRPELLYVADLGCGLGEYSFFGRYKDYVGIDLNDIGDTKNFVQADYHDFNFLERLPFRPTAFVSLFSIECCHPTDKKYALYEKIFAEVPSIDYGLAGGFFYENRHDLETIEETGGLISYQTIEDPSKHISESFDELRLHMHTPSKMFGEDVVEVWKILSRR